MKVQASAVSLTNNLFFILICLFLISCAKPQIDTLKTLPEWGPSRWMGTLPSNLSLAQISIPGTHKSNALYGCNFDIRIPIVGVQTGDLWKCQDKPIKEQLKMGIRYLDICCRRYGNAFIIHHSIIYQHLNFQDVLDACISFLQENPSETIILKIQEEQVAFEPQAGTDSFINIFNTYTNQYPDLFYKPTNRNARVIPTLGEARGKIIFLKRFEGSLQSPLGMDIAITENTTSTYNISATEKLRVQDFYKPKNATEKITYFLPLLEESFGQNTQVSTLYLNHTSACLLHTISVIDQTIPAPYYISIAKDMGNFLLNTLKNKGKGNTGIVAMDFVSPSHCDAIIKTNALIGRKKQ
ncbi:MAG: phosphatidylinositol-specific phospholipase C [Sphingobacteriaceae bacterium]|nr:MAG: phosphatidylinositol-specific phospholipase C domain-containing protein [Pedobacter sp.]